MGSRLSPDRIPPRARLSKTGPQPWAKPYAGNNHPLHQRPGNRSPLDEIRQSRRTSWNYRNHWGLLEFPRLAFQRKEDAQLRIAVVGASGFVGQAVTNTLRLSGCETQTIPSPRISCGDPQEVLDHPISHPSEVARLANQLAGAEVVVNCAGVPDASSRDIRALLGANAALPGLIGAAALEAGLTRFVHVSSAVVQGRRPVLDESSATEPFSTYSWSKALGEAAVSQHCGSQAVIYRPPSVHAPGRRVTASLIRLSRSPLRSVAGQGNQPTPQALLENVASAVAHLCLTTSTPPLFVAHPWEGLTTRTLMKALGDKEPHHLPSILASQALKLGRYVAKSEPRIAANIRRVEMCWFGQGQADSWLTQDGWKPPLGVEHWELLRYASMEGQNH